MAYYDHITAYHYSAFRPKLHRPILSRCIPENIKFDLGLDIGCGTGQSSIALTHYCKKVIGIDPSEAMVQASLAHPKVEYHFGDAENLNFASNHFDIVTFAGSLFYAKSQELLDEVVRISKPAAKIIVYDFEILLAGILAKLQVSPYEEEIPYNHKENFAGLKNEMLKYVVSASEKITLNIRPSDMVHLLLSEKNSYDCLSSRLGNEALYDKIRKQLVGLWGEEDRTIQAPLFYSVYECEKKR